MGDLVVVGSCNGVLYAFDDLNGDIIWEYDITRDGNQNNFHGDALVANDVLYIGTDGTSVGHVYAFDWATGEVRWKHPVGRGVATDIIRFRNMLYATTLDDELICLDRATGAPLWTHPSGATGLAAFSGDPAVDGATVYFGGLDGVIRSLDAFTGDLIWETPLASRIRTSVTVVGGAVYAGTEDSTLYRVDAESGSVLSKFSLPGMPLLPIASDGKRVAVYIDWDQSSSRIAALDRRLDELIWQQSPAEGDKWTSSRPHVVDGAVVVGSANGSIDAYDFQSGRPAWSLRIDGTVRGISFTDSTVFAGTLGGKVCSVRRYR